MHIAIIGAGALGAVYGTRLANSGARISFVVRPSRVGDNSSLRCEQVGRSEQDVLQLSTRLAAVPDDCDLIVLAVRVDNIDSSLQQVLASAPAVPVICLTPLFPNDLEVLRTWVPGRLVSAMPSLSAYQDDRGVVRYWASRTPPTLVDGAWRNDARVRGFVDALREAGIAAGFEDAVDRLNLAVTMLFFPLVLLIDASAGRLDNAMNDAARLRTSLRAVDECRRLARRVGKLPLWASAASRLALPLTLRAGFSVARRHRPEAIHFLEQHFGNKTHQQNLRMAQQILTQSDRLGVPMPAFRELVALVRREG